MLSSLCQVSDVALVHDERSLMDPPADEALGYCKLVGAEVVTETGAMLGRVRCGREQRPCPLLRRCIRCCRCCCPALCYTAGSLPC